MNMASSRKCWHLATQALRVRVGVAEQVLELLGVKSYCMLLRVFTNPYDRKILSVFA